MSIAHFQTTTNTGPLVELFDTNVTDGAVLPETSAVYLQFIGDGRLNIQAETVFNTIWYRYAPSGSIGADYEIRLTVASGDPPTSGPGNDVWLPMSTSRLWTLTQGNVGTSQGGWFIEIRLVSNDAIVASATYTMTATTSI